MPRSTASHYHDALRTEKLFSIVNHGRERHVVALHIDASSHTVIQTLRLLENLLQHEVVVAALLYLTEVDIHRLYFQLLFFAKNAHYLKLFAQTNDSNVAILQIHHLVRIIDNRTGIRAYEEFILANAYYKRTLFAGSNNLAGVALVHDSDGIGTYHLMQRHLHGFEQRQVLLHHDILHKLHENLSICVALEFYALRLKLRLDVGIVFDDAVMDDGKVVSARIVRMGISCRGLTMSRPPRMGNTHTTGDILVAAILRQVVNLSFGLIYIEVAAVTNHGYASTVIASVFKTF